ncbi:MAG: Eco57I restriction-modification methylase domain-containing protein, partial [Verrucomicrobiota bacterium]
MTQDQIQAILRKAYDRQGWLQVLREILPGTEVFASPQVAAVPVPNAPQAVQLARVRLGDRKQLAVLEVKVGDRIDLLRNRVGLRNVVARFIDQAEYHGVLAVFLAPQSDFRFTFAARMAELDAEGTLVRRETTPRRYTYILGPNESCRTAAERFLHLSESGLGATLADVTDAFSVEKLNKEFFDQFRKCFVRMADDILASNKGWERPEAEGETQMLLSRLLFLYFIQRKGWLNRRRDYLVSAFRRHDAQDPNGSSFYDKFIKHFFVKLASEDAFFPNLDLGDLPFLNGGLFDDEMEALNQRGRMRVNNATFRYVFDNLLEAYNFTVREDTPLDQEVAIDPEMLGKLFESLVLQLEQSDVGGETSRHDTGSYYTPRPIVHYLCREGIRAWLEQFPPSPVAASRQSAADSSAKKDAPVVAHAVAQIDWPQRLEKILSLTESEGLGVAERATLDSLLTPDEATEILDRLDNFRACDPAVGSGALLVGLLHELVSLKRLCATRARGKDPAEGDSDWFYEAKKRIIENTLYGVDIQERAVEICKLRLWLSLMVDYPLDVVADNCALPEFRRALKKITPLPNLDFKIRRANSLIEQIRGHAVDFPQANIDSRDLTLSLNKLATAKHRFYEARRNKDKRLAQLDILDATADLAKYEFSAAKLKYGILPGDKDAARVVELAKAESEMGRLGLQISAARRMSERQKDEAIERLSRVFNDEAKPTFVWQLDFAEIFHHSGSVAAPAVAFRALAEGSPCGDAADAGGRDAYSISGFDLVLANPPYVRQEKFKDQKPMLENTFECYTGVADLYVYFYERGVRLLGKGGVLSFISSNKFYRAGYGERLRGFLARELTLRRLIDFGDAPVFEAIAYASILVGVRAAPAQQSSALAYTWEEEKTFEHIAQIVPDRGQQIRQSELKPEGWRLESPAVFRLLEKLRLAGKPLGEYVNGRFYRGILTGLNEAFIVDRETRDRLICEDKSSATILKPFLRGREVKRWGIEPQNFWLIFTRRGIDIKKYPAIYKQLLPLKEQ